MRVIQRSPVEDCFDKELMWELRLSHSIDEALVRWLGRGVDLEYHPDFPRPYFCVRDPARYMLQGVVGESHLRVTLTRSSRSTMLEDLARCIEDFPGTKGDADGSQVGEVLRAGR